MQKYKTLKQAFHEDSSNSRFENNKALAQRRREEASAFRSGIYLGDDELFYVVPQELAILTERVLRLERKVSRLWRTLPPIARISYTRDLIAQEIVNTNHIEGIRSTRKEVEEALLSIALPESREQKRFAEFANLYLNLTTNNLAFPRNPTDIRKIYDDVIARELEEGDTLDGELFRAGPVSLTDGQRTVHEGVNPESKIVEMLRSMIRFVESEETPAIYSAILSHFLFEYIHPFYDGNGRVGRFLLALYLSEPLSVTTVLSLSRVIAENRSRYYKAFTEVEDKLNHGDATYFLIEMMSFIRLAQENLEEELSIRANVLAHGIDRIEEIGLESEIEEGILFDLLQIHLFATTKAENLSVIAASIERSEVTARKYLSRLEDAGYIRAVSRRPLYFALTEKTLNLVGYNTGKNTTEQDY